METELNRNTQNTLDFRRYLQSELVRRTKVNPKYSLRAFARSLGIQPNFLSKILLGQRSVTHATIIRLGLKLGLTPTEIDGFAQKAAQMKSTTAVLVPSYQTLMIDHYHVISDWYHFAMLELATVQNFIPKPQWIARVLGVTVTEVHAAIERLVRLDFLEIKENGKWIILDKGNSTTIGSELTSSALRKMQKQILTQALVALEEVPIEKRDQTSMTMAIDSSLIPEAKLRITRFRRELSSFLENGKKKDQVYQLALSLFPLTQIEDKKGANKK
jgi:uncharacterized protein (TIGR02147 family)